MKYQRIYNWLLLMVLLMFGIHLTVIKNAKAGAVLLKESRSIIIDHNDTKSGYPDYMNCGNSTPGALTGAITVTIEPPLAIEEGAKWKLRSEPDTLWHESGDTIENLHFGSYTLIFKNIDGWGKLINKQIKINEDETTDISVIYRSLKLLSQLTDNDFNDHSPQINPSGFVVWHGHDGHDDEIFLYDGTRVSQLTDNNHYDEYPQINPSGQVVWRGDYGPEAEIYLYNGQNITNISDNDRYDGSPQINPSGHVVWHGESDVYGWDEIYLYDGIKITQLTNNAYIDDWPQINSSGHVVWRGEDLEGDYDEDIFLYDGTTVINISDNVSAGNDFGHQINSKGHVVWSGDIDFDFGAIILHYEIFLYDGTRVTRLTYSGQNFAPQINPNGHVVWTGSDGHDSEIFLYDGRRITQITNNDYNDYEAQINPCGYVVWAGSDGHDSEIFLYDGRCITQITDNDFDDNEAQINPDGYLVWTGYDGHDSEIFILKLIETNIPGDFSMSLIPVNRVAYRNETLEYFVEIANNRDFQQDFDFWVTIRLPNGTIWPENRAFFGPSKMTLAANETILKRIVHNVPGNAHSGDHRLNAFVGNFPLTVIDQASFEFFIMQ
jgi:hypothetical protein